MMMMKVSLALTRRLEARLGLGTGRPNDHAFDSHF